MGCYQCGSDAGTSVSLCPACTAKRLTQREGLAGGFQNVKSPLSSGVWLYAAAAAAAVVVILVCLFMQFKPALVSHFTITEAKGPLLHIKRSRSDFGFKNLGPLAADFRVLGFNPNPFGGDNRDEYVESFGVALLSTHILVVTGKDVAARAYQREHCEMSLGSEKAMMAVIAKDQQVSAALDELARRGGRTCAHVEGVKLAFESWYVDGKPESAQVVSRMAREAGGIRFSEPLLLESIRTIDCD